jgi:hypothetical protein
LANSVSSLNPTFWAREAEKSLFVDNKAMAIANTTLRNLVAGEGDTVKKVIVSYPASSTYTPGSDITSNAISGSSESLSIATWLASRVVIDDTERAQSIIELGQNISNKMMMDHNNRIEQAVLAEATNSQWTIDDGNVGGTAGNNATVNTNTIPQFFIAADTKLDAIDAPKAGRTAVVGGHFMGQLKLQQAGRPTVFGDGVNTRGIVTNLFGWDILYSNNLPYTAVFTLTTNPTDGDTVTIAGVTFTFKTTLGTTAGNVHICSDAAHTRATFAAALNAVDTSVASATDAGYVKVSDENIFLLRDKRRISAVDDTSTKITLSGYGDIVVAQSMTAAANVWSSQRQDSLFLVAGSIDIIVQIPPHIEVIRDPKQFADNVKSLLGFGKKTYADGARQMVRVKLNAGTSDWA